MKIAARLSVWLQLTLLVALIAVLFIWVAVNWTSGEAKEALLRKEVDALRQEANLCAYSIREDLRWFGMVCRDAARHLETTSQPEAQEFEAQRRLLLEQVATLANPDVAGPGTPGMPALGKTVQAYQKRHFDPRCLVEVRLVRFSPAPTSSSFRLRDGAWQEGADERAFATVKEVIAPFAQDVLIRQKEGKGHKEFRKSTTLQSALTLGKSPRPAYLLSIGFPILANKVQPDRLLVVTIDFTRLVNNLAQHCPRVRIFVATKDSDWVVHPDPDQIGEPINWPLAASDPVIPDQQTARALLRSQGKRLPPQHIPKLRYYFARETFNTDEGRKFMEENWRQLRHGLEQLAQQEPSLRFGPIHERTNRLELSSNNVQTIEQAEKMVRLQQRTAGAASEDWQTARCENFFGHLVPLWLSIDLSDEPLGLAVVAAGEEVTLEVSVAAQQILLWPGLPIGLAGCGLALLASFLITRPLRRIRDAARRLAEGDYAVELPVRGLGEVGQLARSVHDMIGQIRARDQDLRRLNEELEHRVKLRTAELQDATHRLEAALDETRQANTAKDRLISTVSHELRTPLTSVIGYTQLLLNPKASKLRETPQPTLTKILTASKHLLALVNDLLDVGRYTSGRPINLEPSTFALTPFLQGIAEMTAPLAKKNNNHLHVEIPDDLGTAHTDETRVRQILLNLLGNACKFTEKGTVSLKAWRQADPTGRDWLTFVVSDTGAGMTAEQMRHLFEPFYRVENEATRKAGGAGLGLSISRAVAAYMGGEVTVASEAGVGSTFTVRLPTRLESTEIRRTLVPPPALVPASEPEPRREHLILVVDDDASIRQLLATFLEQEGYEAVTAANGLDGLRLARELRPSLITVDVMMPELDGWATLTALKSDPLTRDVPVVMLTIVEEQARGFALGAADYLSKPVDWDRLRGIVSRYCQPASTVLVVEDDPLQRDCLAQRLRLLGWEALEAANGREALERLAKHRPALVLLDLMMPVMDGFEFLDELWRRPELNHGLPIVVLTAKDLTQEERARLEGSVTQVIGKGTTTAEEVLAQVAARLQKMGKDRPPTQTEGGRP